MPPKDSMTLDSSNPTNPIDSMNAINVFTEQLNDAKTQGLLNMQDRRRNQAGQALDPTKEKIKVPPEYWQDLKRKDFRTVCRNALAADHAPEGLLLGFLGETHLDRHTGISLEDQQARDVGRF